MGGGGIRVEDEDFADAEVGEQFSVECGAKAAAAVDVVPVAARGKGGGVGESVAKEELVGNDGMDRAVEDAATRSEGW